MAWPSLRTVYNKTLLQGQLGHTETSALQARHVASIFAATPCCNIKSKTWPALFSTSILSVHQNLHWCCLRHGSIAMLSSEATAPGRGQRPAGDRFLLLPRWASTSRVMSAPGRAKSQRMLQPRERSRHEKASAEQSAFNVRGTCTEPKSNLRRHKLLVMVDLQSYALPCSGRQEITHGAAAHHYC